MFKKFIAYYRPHRGLFILDMSIAVVSSFLSVLFPMLTHRLLKDYIPNQNLKGIVTILISILLIYLITSFFNYIRIKWGHILGVRMEYDMRSDFFRHIQKLSFSYYDNVKTGHIMSRITSDLENIAEVAHHAPEDLLISLCMILGAYGFMFSLNLPLALISLIPLPLMLIWGIIQRKRLKAQFRNVRVKIADINATVENSVQGIREVKSYANESLETKKFDRANSVFKESKEAVYTRMGIFHSVIGFLRELYYFTVIAGGSLLIYKELVDVSDLLAFLLYVGIILPPIDRLINFVEQYSSGEAAFERFIEIMDIEPDIKDAPHAAYPPKAEGNINLKDIYFQYEKEDVLKGVSLQANQGEMIALVGESGAGKSTLVSLIPRFYEAQKGSITIDGYNINEVSQRWLRENIGLVQQNVFLFDATIGENILYGKTDATEQEMIAAAKAAHIYDFINSLPEGFNTSVGERGVKLSGGQKQRIAIARIFLKNPPILIFDEATSALDSESEAFIQESMKELCKGRTTLVIAHRLSTVRDANSLIVMKEGQVVEQGSHDQLFEKGGYYTSLYKKNQI